jgi:hypothetical protein
VRCCPQEDPPADWFPAVHCDKKYEHHKTSEGQSSWIETRLGVRQGSVLSPTLFDVIMNKICNKIRKKNKETDLKLLYIQIP